jgi:hypothetical protein
LREIEFSDTDIHDFDVELQSFIDELWAQGGTIWDPALKIKDEDRHAVTDIGTFAERVSRKMDSRQYLEGLCRCVLKPLAQQEPMKLQELRELLNTWIMPARISVYPNSRRVLDPPEKMSFCHVLASVVLMDCIGKSGKTPDVFPILRKQPKHAGLNIRNISDMLDSYPDIFESLLKGDMADIGMFATAFMACILVSDTPEVRTSMVRHVTGAFKAYGEEKVKGG